MFRNYEKSLVAREVIIHLRTFEKHLENSRIPKDCDYFIGGGPYYTETNQSIFTADRLTDFQRDEVLLHEAVVAL